MTGNIITFRGVGVRSRPASRRPGKSYSRGENGPNMQRLLFRASNLIVESDEADLVRDVGFAVDRAQTKLKAIQRRLKGVREHAAAQVKLLTDAETKLTAAIVAAQLSTRGHL
jgi:hypothetical protein